MGKLHVAILIFFPFFLTAQNTDWDSKTITVEDGLQADAVRAIIKDRQGFIWFGTALGLQRYDGYQMKSYQYNTEGKKRISHYNILDLAEDPDGNIWIATSNGLNEYDPKEDTFTQFFYDPDDSTTLSNSNIRTVYVDKNGIVWAGTVNGLNRLDRAKGTFTRYYTDHSGSEIGNSINCIYEDKNGAFWIGTTNSGLYQMDRANGKFQHFSVDSADLQSPGNFVTCIYEDRGGTLWIATFNGLYQFNRRDKKYTRFLYKPGGSSNHKNQRFTAIIEDGKGDYWIRTYDGLYHYNTNMEMHNSWKHYPHNANQGPWLNLKCIYPDSSGIIWYNTHWEGIEQLIPKTKKFRFYRHHPEIEGPGLRDIHVDREEIWMGDIVGLSRFDRKTNEYTRFQHDPDGLHSISDDAVSSILRDHTGTLWVGTYHGLNRLVVSKDSTYRFERYYHDPKNPASIGRDLIWGIYEDTEGRLYFDLHDDFIDLYDRENYEFLHVQFPQQNFQSGNGTIYLAESDKIWYANKHGLLEMVLPFRKSGPYCVTPDTVFQYNSIDEGSMSLSQNEINRVFKDSKGSYWIATFGNGLYKRVSYYSERYDSVYYKFIHYTIENGLPDDNIGSILEDKNNNLWIGTKNGISKFNPVRETFINYHRADGLVSLQFHGEANKAPDGEMFFPSDDGLLLAFYPDSIGDNRYSPPIVITELRLANKLVSVGDDSPLQVSISHANEIELPFKENFLSFEYAALNYIQPEKNKYKYKMEGLDEDWIESGTRRYASYPDLKPGSYVFRVIGSNNDNIWNTEGASLAIKIFPPWWTTEYAYAGYAMLALLLVVGYVRLKTWQISKERDRLEKQVGQRTEEIQEQKNLLAEQNEKILEMDRMKTRFFTNVSHEFRTPIAMIQGPVKDLLEKARLNTKEQSKLQMVSRNAGRLLTLVNQLLDIAKLESGTMKLKLVEGNIMANLRTITGSFSSLAETKGIVYNRILPREAFVTWFDPGILEKVLTNLLSNAFKFTPEAGEIAFTARLIKSESAETPDQIECTVTDQGPGIPIEDQEKIFTRFYQVEGQKTTMGTGIGLSLVKDLVQLCHGAITVESEEGIGSTFIVKLPLGKEHLKENEYVLVEKTEEEKGAQAPAIPVDAGIDPPSEKPLEEVKGFDKPIVLIVEDNSDIRSHILEHLEDKYEVVESVNGQAGQIKAFEIIPDLVITDLMMPVMDGDQLCKEIKSDERTSHIPVIMLTARATQEAKLEGLETGADDYIAKPFDIKELKTRIANLIEQRKKLRERYSREITLEPKAVAITSVDEEFLERAIDIVEKRMADEHFDMKQFQDAMHMSHSTLFRKLQALTDQSPTVFIRNIRLKRAAQLLREHYGNVASVSYEVGFSNPSYFSKCFKELYGVSPADYTSVTTSLH